MRELLAQAVMDNKDAATCAAFSDWLEEAGECPELVKELRNRFVPVLPIIETTKEELTNEYSDWLYVFGEEGCSDNESNHIDPCPPGSDVSLTPVERQDVKEVIASVNGENDGDEWVGVFLLYDGRYLLATGSCDYTGWG